MTMLRWRKPRAAEKDVARLTATGVFGTRYYIYGNPNAQKSERWSVHRTTIPTTVDSPRVGIGSRSTLDKAKACAQAHENASIAMGRGLYPTPGHFFDHPDDGPVFITGGQREINGRISNHFYWTVVATGEHKNGYADDWPCIDDQWEVTFKSRDMKQ